MQGESVLSLGDVVWSVDLEEEEHETHKLQFDQDIAVGKY